MIEVDVKATGANIKRIMAEKNIKPLVMAHKLYVARECVYNWRTGNRLPRIDYLVNIADICGVSIDDILVLKEVGGKYEDWVD